MGLDSICFAKDVASVASEKFHRKPKKNKIDLSVSAFENF